MGYQFLTRHGHNMYDMASMLQKSIRRCDFRHAGYAAMELYRSYENYLWRRLIVISAEDCHGVITREIVALKTADDICNKGRKKEEKDPLFVAKAVTLLCKAQKNRDACYFACNFMLPDKTLEDENIEHVNPDDYAEYSGDIPEWVYDCHTLKGKANGKTDLDMTEAEQKALEPKQLGFFDDGDWEDYYSHARKNGKCSDVEWNKYQEFKQSKKHID